MATTAKQRIDVGKLRNGDAILVVDAHDDERHEIAATLRYDYGQLGELLLVLLAGSVLIMVAAVGGAL